MKKRRSDEDGQAILEYALIIAGLSILMASLIAAFGTGLITDTQLRIAEFLG